MIREAVHFVRHVPGVARLFFRLSHGELYDELMERADVAGMGARRAQLVEGVEGDVLEIGCGTGRMFRHYEPGVRLTALEPDRRFVPLARETARRHRPGARLLFGDAQALPFRDGSFDAVVIFTVLCSVPDVRRALAEVGRVLRPGGLFLLSEHVRSDRLVPSLVMHAVNPLWRLYNRQGCNVNRQVDGPLREAGFRVEMREAFQVWAPGVPAFISLVIRARAE